MLCRLNWLHNSMLKRCPSARTQFEKDQKVVQKSVTLPSGRASTTSGDVLERTLEFLCRTVLWKTAKAIGYS
ncbi:unnamed protein product [Nippostrongylus brasiliensis]|uniref:Uncharacterized protein n=1 Tax=Nippostrongylus brasiliensis TaxID=27835 RepID=A0A0N4XRJ7_NIPBR|nr:unnamed protein product [Nippostrongylus brasiliensis]